MAPHHWQQLKQILGEALEHEGDDRTTFVAQRCGADTDLRHEVESYLKLSGKAVEACAEKMRETLVNKFPSDRIGHRLGAYRIVQEIGRGGMGTVFLAARADGQFEKQVAIKLLKRGTDTDEIVRRFSAERQILAQLEHQSIARLLDAGTTDDGLPYFVMEFVAGAPITKFVQEHQLSIRQRLTLFLKVCAAVERAHRDRIIHRDLKPGNILVTAEGEPKLLDFGIAKLLEPGTDALEATATNEQRLTPTCASPEQARGEPVTVASDIYALGALLYEMLTDRTPHQFSVARPSSEELARVVCEQEPTVPSEAVSDRERGRQLQGDLDNIVLYALRKEPERRYPSVAEFARDVERYLAARPVQARPNTTVYRAQRFLTRHKAGLRWVAASAVLLCSIAVLLLVSPQVKKATGITGGSETTNALAISEKSIAVLPFDNFNTEKESSYFVDGVQDDILTDLAKVSDLKVISRTAVAQYRGVERNAREIGRALGVAHVLEGSVQRSGGRVRVNARLINTRTNTQVWADHYERNVDDLFALQSELAQTIVTQLKATLSPSEKAAIESRPTQDMQAYDLFLKARDAIAQFGDMNGQPWRGAVELLKKAIERDPKFTLAYCLESQAEILLYRYYEHTPERLNRARDLAAMAMQLAPDAGESHLALARYYYHGLRDYARAQKELDLAAPDLSGNAEFLSIAEVTERRLGHWKAALRDGQKALALNPHDAVYASTLFESYNALHMYAEGNKVIDAAIAQLPAESAGPLWEHKAASVLSTGDLEATTAVVKAASGSFAWKSSMLAMIAFCKREYAEALRLLDAMGDKKNYLDYILEGRVQQRLGDAEKSRIAFEEAKKKLDYNLRTRPDDCILLGSLGVTYASLGRKDDAIATARRATLLFPQSQDSIDGANAVSALAEVYTITGEHDAALAELGTIVQVPGGMTWGDLSFNPVWDSLRGDPRFTELLARARKPLVFN
jgi:eukaryotic-like serine/threonine-protein kinase